MNDKLLKERNETAEYIREWKKSYDIKKVSNCFGHGTTKTCRILRRSFQYRHSSKRKSKIYRYLKIKNHPVRNKIAKYLRGWNSGSTAQEIADRNKTDKKTVLHYLQQSYSYRNSVKKLSHDEQMFVKNSPFRKRLALYLNTWRTIRNVGKTAKLLGIKKGVCQLILSKATAYRRFSEIQKGLNKEEVRFVLRFAKKKKIVRMLGGKCRACDNDDIFVLEFHHEDDNKESIVSTLLEGKIECVIEEAKKCKLLCRNCHIKEHSQIELYNKLRHIISYRSIRI